MPSCSREEGPESAANSAWRARRAARSSGWPAFDGVEVVGEDGVEPLFPVGHVVFGDDHS